MRERGLLRRALRALGLAVARLTGFGLTSVVIGVLVAALFAPLVLGLDFGSQAIADGIRRLPRTLKTEPLPQRSVVLDRNGHVLAAFFREDRVNVGLRKVAPVMRKAIIAIEDSRFYEHDAIDLKGTLRALVQNSAGSESVQGGSTITQQLVKMERIQQAENKKELRKATEKSYARKLRELQYALALEKKHDKDWILRRYLNIAYFGDGAYGIEAAARHYFSKPAKKLRLRQAALLAGLVKNPTGYDPTNNKHAARARRNVVIARMADLGVIPKRRARHAERKGLGLELQRRSNGCVSTAAPFFCQYVREWLLGHKSLGRTPQERAQLLRTGGLTIRTTIDLRMQRAADASVRSHVFPKDDAVGGLAMVEPGTGAVRALAQSRPMGGDRSRGQTFLNYTVPERYGDADGFQAGSTFKVFVLAAAVDEGMALDTEIEAPPQAHIPVDRYRGCKGHLRSSAVWEPSNSTGSGTFNLYQGTQQSVNTFFAKLELRTGLCRPYRLAKQMGIALNDPDNQQVPSFTLGVVDTDPVTMAGAYATFAARGVHCPPRPVVSITDRHGKRLRRYAHHCQRVLPQAVADAVNDVLRGVQEPGGFGYYAGLALAQPSAGKTGTTNSNRSVWFLGYTPDLAAAAMVAGVDDAGHWKTLNGQRVGGVLVGHAAGSTTAGPIWGDAMHVVQQWLPDRNFVRPDPTVLDGVQVRLPDVRGLRVGTATRRLEDAGFGVRTGPSTSSLYPAGTVAATRPKVGSMVSSGRTVVLRPAR